MSSLNQPDLYLSFHDDAVWGLDAPQKSAKDTSSTAFEFNGDLSNTGIITLDIEFGSDRPDNTFFNSGSVTGNVTFGIGADRYLGSQDGVVVGNVYGGRGDDRLFGTGEKDNFYGGKADDVLRGAAGKDRLFGGAGDDDITGGKGKDVMGGGSGEDTFIFHGSTGRDKIKDFTNGQDQLDLTAYDLNGFKQLKNAGAIVKDGAGSQIDLDAIGGNGVILTDDMAVSDWNKADFIL